jgi:hypothetical protein
MRYNPPPNWPKPPEGWAPHPEWSPDPSWPPPPPGWQLWVEDEVAPRAKSTLGRLESTGDDVEYFGDDRAWSEDSGPPSGQGHLSAAAQALPARPTEIAPADLSAHHLGRYATIKWDNEHKYDIGKIVAVSADSAAISVKLGGIDTPVSFPREVAPGGTANPRLYVWI